MSNLEALRSDPKLHALLAAYALQKRQHPELDWHDRIMDLPPCTPTELNRLHGLLLANGWIETRVHGDSFRTAGRLAHCYRVTPDGAALLKFAGPGSAIPDEESQQVL